MKKVLIVDDELLVQVGLKSMINWQEHGLYVVAEAKNGQEAIELFNRTDPDIVFVDIGMPGMNGLELIKILKEKKPSVKTVILTSHTDFNYVKEAVSLNVSEYLLKSELTRDSLSKCINNIVTQMEAETSEKYKIENAESVNTGYLVEDDLFKIITGFYKSREEMEAIIEKYKFSFQQSVWLVAVSSIMIKADDLERYQKDTDHFKTVIQGLLKQVFSEEDFTFYATIIIDKIIFLFNIDKAKDISAVKEKIMNLLYLFKSNLKQFLNIDLFIGISKPGESYRQLPELYKQAYNAREYCFFESDKIITYDESLLHVEESMPKVNYKAIEKLLLKGDVEGLEQSFNDIFGRLYDCRNKEYVRTAFIDLLSQAKLFVESLHEKQNIPDLNEANFNYNRFQNFHTFEEVKKYITDVYKKIIQAEKNQRGAQYSCSIQKSIEYIEKNYQRNITLADVAKYAEVSKNYLSFLFKQEIGTNFSTFLMNFRIEKSKELLTEGNVKIYEIANMVGFENPYYFSKVFKEVVGVSCKEYQRLYYKSNK